MSIPLLPSLLLACLPSCCLLDLEGAFNAFPSDSPSPYPIVMSPVGLFKAPVQVYATISLPFPTALPFSAP